ncbi:MAG: hypothetical protein NZL89_07380, partial [Leptospiraceae bacterium]|nr:hypothetical protein [Leptospiraceae bacterium]
PVALAKFQLLALCIGKQAIVFAIGFESCRVLKKFYHTGLKPIALSTISEVNSKRNAKSRKMQGF